MDGAAPEPVVISQNEALERRLTRYFTGVPCKNGHLSERTVFGGNCLACMRLRANRDNERRRSGSIYHRDAGKFGPNPPPETMRWPDDGGAKRVDVVNPVSGRTAKAGWVKCLGHLSVFEPHRFFTQDVVRVRVCGRCIEDSPSGLHGTMPARERRGIKRSD